MNIGVVANPDPARATGLILKLQEATSEADQIILVDGSRRCLPANVNVVLLISSMLRHCQVDRFVALCRKKGLKYVRTPHYWSTLVSHCRREGLIPEEIKAVAQPTLESEAVAQEPEDLEIEALRARLTHAERELSVLRRTNQQLQLGITRTRKLDRPPTPMQDRPTLDPPQLLRLWSLARSPRRKARMNILCTAIEFDL